MSGVRMRWAPLTVRRWAGMGGIASLALAVLVFGCVLVATAGPRLATMGPGPGQRARLVLPGVLAAAALVLGIEIRARRKVVATLRGGE